jgi:hypothetical protein
MHFTAELMRFFSRAGELVRIYLDRIKFDEARARSGG